jgi:hypothetical protein
MWKSHNAVYFFRKSQATPYYLYTLSITSKNARALQREEKICLFALLFSGKGFTTGYDRELYRTHNS